LNGPISVGMADMRVLRGEGRFTCLGLGSCIGVAALDPVTHVGGMLHVMLPKAFAGRPDEKPGKFADTGIPAFVAMLVSEGANKRRLRIALAGGAQVFKFNEGSGTSLEIGARNAAAVAEELGKLGLRAIAQDVGGTKGRTMTMNMESGEVRLRALGQEERTLCNLS
jgi:chemotaxis protein CheD